MKIEMIKHYGVLIEDGKCDKTLCGYTGEIPCDNSYDVWEKVTCKKCLKIKAKYKESFCQETDILDYLDYLDSIENEELNNET